MKLSSRFFVGFLSLTLLSISVPVFADQTSCQKVGNKTDLTIRDVRNRFDGANQSLPSVMIMQEGLMLEIIVGTNECDGVSGTEVEVRENNTLIKRVAIPSIGPNGSGSPASYISWTPFAAGTRTLTFKVDPNNTIPESSESNNVYTKSIAVSPTGSRDIRFKRMASSAVGNPHIGEVLQFDGDIEILNNKKQTGLMTIGWYVDGKLIKTQEIDLSVISDTTIHSIFDWIATKGSHTVSLKSDIYNVVTEISKANNGGELKFTVDASSQSGSLASGVLVKNKKFAEVFSVDENRCLHWIPNEAAAVHYFGVDWEKKITSYDQLSSSWVFCESLPAPEAISSSADSDGDGLSDTDESQTYGTDPENSDTDGDGYGDGQEIQNGYNPKGLGRL